MSKMVNLKIWRNPSHCSKSPRFSFDKQYPWSFNYTKHTNFPMRILYRRFDINTMFCKKWLSRFFHVFKICIWHNEKMLHLWTSHLPILIGSKKISVVFHFGSTKNETGFRNDWKWKKRNQCLMGWWRSNVPSPPTLTWHLLLPIWNFTFWHLLEIRISFCPHGICFFQSEILHSFNFPKRNFFYSYFMLPKI